MKRLSIQSVILILVLMTTPLQVHACDPLGCLFGGKDQDLLVLGEIISENSNKLKQAKIFYIFPQTKLKETKVGDLINIDDSYLETGKKYLLSLSKKDDLFLVKWGRYEILGNSEKDAKLVSKNSIDDEAIEIFITSGGNEKDFFFDYSKDPPVLLVHSSKSITEPNTNASQTFIQKALSVVWLVIKKIILIFNFNNWITSAPQVEGKPTNILN